MLGVFGGLVAGSALGGVIAQVWSVTGVFWFAFVGSAIILVAIWRTLERIAARRTRLIGRAAGRLGRGWVGPGTRR